MVEGLEGGVVSGFALDAGDFMGEEERGAGFADEEEEEAEEAEDNGVDVEHPAPGWHISRVERG